MTIPTAIKRFHPGKYPLLMQIARFSITGTMASVVHFLSVVIIVERWGVHPLDANILGFLTGFIVSFSGHHFWTFSQTTRSISFSLPMFLLLAGINFSINQSLFYLLLERLQMNYSPALAIVLLIVGAFTFMLSKLWIFKK